MLLGVMLLVGCERDAEAETPALGLLRDSLQLDRSVALHSVALGGGRGVDHVVPERTMAEPGDVIAFHTVDGRLRILAFEPDSMSPELTAFLEETNQLESPPLLDRGSRFVVDLAEAPPGRYVFHTRTGGPAVFGSVVVQSR